MRAFVIERRDAMWAAARPVGSGFRQVSAEDNQGCGRKTGQKNRAGKRPTPALLPVIATGRVNLRVRVRGIASQRHAGPAATDLLGAEGTEPVGVERGRRGGVQTRREAVEQLPYGQPVSPLD